MSVTDSHGVAFTNSYSVSSNKMGMKILSKINGVINSITKPALSDATKGYLTDASRNVLASGDFVGNECTFTTNNSIQNNINYYVLIDKAGVNYTLRYKSQAGYPAVNTNINWVAGFSVAQVDDTGIWDGVESVTSTETPKYTAGQKGIKTSWDELTATDSTKYIGHEQTLKAEKSYVIERNKAGI